jgi:Domain of unknown function (DUF4412)
VNSAFRFFVILLFTACSVAAIAQEDFSGDWVDTTQHNRNQAKIAATKEKLRIEPQGGEKSVIIVNLSTHTSYGLMPERKMYMEIPQGQTPSMWQWSRQLFRPSDVNDVCSEWLKLPVNRGGTCKNLGSETVNGRSTIKFEGTNSEGEKGYAWMDKKISFPIKWQEKNNTWELQNIKEGSQPANLFEIPAGYQKFQMPAGMQNMQRPQ